MKLCRWGMFGFGWDILYGHICDYDYWCFDSMMHERYACCDIYLMIGWDWIVGETMLMVRMILIVCIDGWLEMVLLEIGMRKYIEYDIVFKIELFDWDWLKW